MEQIAGPRPLNLAADNARRPASSAMTEEIGKMELAAEAAVAPVHRNEGVRPREAQRLQDTSQAPVSQADGTAASAVPPLVRTERNIEFDPITRDVIFQSLSSDTGEIVAQVPSEAQLKIRQYARTGRDIQPASTVKRTA